MCIRRNGRPPKSLKTCGDTDFLCHWTLSRAFDQKKLASFSYKLNSNSNLLQLRSYHLAFFLACFLECVSIASSARLTPKSDKRATTCHDTFGREKPRSSWLQLAKKVGNSALALETSKSPEMILLWLLASTTPLSDSRTHFPWSIACDRCFPWRKSLIMEMENDKIIDGHFAGTSVQSPQPPRKGTSSGSPWTCASMPWKLRGIIKPQECCRFCICVAFCLPWIQGSSWLFHSCCVIFAKTVTGPVAAWILSMAGMKSA